jgi:transcriptional regulator with XRE-family HTH domain
MFNKMIINILCPIDELAKHFGFIFNFAQKIMPNKGILNKEIEKKAKQQVNSIVSKIAETREKKYKLDSMADELGITTPAYLKVEKQETNLTLERFFQLQMLLDIPLNELLDVKADTIYNQKLSDQSVGHFEIQNLHQDNKELTESLIKNLQEEVAFLRGIIKERLG